MVNTKIRLIIFFATKDGKALYSQQKQDWELTVAQITNSLFPNAATAAKSLQSCPALCDPIDCSPPGSAVPGILQARILEWVAISFSNAWKRKVKMKLLSCVRLLVTPWTAAYQYPPSMDFPGKSTGVGCHCLLHLISKFRLKLKEVGKTTRPFRYDLNQISYNYTVEVTNRFKGLYLIDRVADEL